MRKLCRCRITGIQFQEVVILVWVIGHTVCRTNQNGKFYNYNNNSLAIHQTNEKKPLEKELQLSIQEVYIIQSSSSSRLNPVNSSSLSHGNVFLIAAYVHAGKGIILLFSNNPQTRRENSRQDTLLRKLQIDLANERTLHSQQRIIMVKTLVGEANNYNNL